MRILVTGAAGFIGMHTALALAEEGHDILGLDNYNSYYDPSLKRARAAQLQQRGIGVRELDIRDGAALDACVADCRPDVIVHLAAQAGVRHSLTHPHEYTSTNVEGMLNILEASHRHGIQHLVYASSSSVYGLNSAIPFSEAHPTEHPVSVYAATKKAGEMLAHAYSHLYALPTTGLRFFTVYGPWGRPDMAPAIFTDAILHDRPIQLFNNGRLERDFTYVADVARAVAAIATGTPPAGVEEIDSGTSTAPYRILNVGNSTPVAVTAFIGALEDALGKRARLQLCPMQPGDVERTYADTRRLQHLTGITPDTPLEQGIRHFTSWYTSYYTL